jgi:hypothetical protein
LALPIPTVADTRTQQAFNFLRSIFPLGRQYLAEQFGEVEVAKESSKEVEHKLGGTPVNVQLTKRLNEDVAESAPYVKSVGETKFTIRNPSAKAISVYWRAVT